MRDFSLRVPDLIRDLHFARRRGPGSSPGRVRTLPAVYHSTPLCTRATFRLHYGVQTGWRALRWPHAKPAGAHSESSRRPFRSYRKVQYQNPSLVRDSRRLQRQPQTRARHQALAACMEKSTHPSKQSALAGCYRADPFLIRPEVPAQGRDGNR